MRPPEKLFVTSAIFDVDAQTIYLGAIIILEVWGFQLGFGGCKGCADNDV
jgi:hypothetical protein